VQPEQAANFDRTLWGAQRRFHFDEQVEIAPRVSVPARMAAEDDNFARMEALDDALDDLVDEALVNHGNLR
jgi:hypothetical protein